MILLRHICIGEGGVSGAGFLLTTGDGEAAGTDIVGRCTIAGARMLMVLSLGEADSDRGGLLFATLR